MYMILRKSVYFLFLSIYIKALTAWPTCMIEIIHSCILGTLMFLATAGNGLQFALLGLFSHLWWPLFIPRYMT